MRIFYTDGSAKKGNLEAGGWAILELKNEKIILEKYDADFSLDVTNNKMELKAAIEAARLVQPNEEAKIHSDSQYVVKGISEWIFSWIKNGWKTGKKEDVLNQPLWRELLQEVKDKKIQWVWVRGHANDPYNNRVDKLSYQVYLEPEKIEILKTENKTNETKKEKEIIQKPKIGSILYFDNPSKKYTVILNDIRSGKEFGFLAKLLSNSHGYEMDFFSYKEKFTLIEEKHEKEQKLSFHCLNVFNQKVQEDYYKFKDQCEHHIRNEDDVATCTICQEDFGWWCKKSPDHLCHYFSKNGFIELKNKEKVAIPKNHDDSYETYDSCIFCGMPDERK